MFDIGRMKVFAMVFAAVLFVAACGGEEEDGAGGERSRLTVAASSDEGALNVTSIYKPELIGLVYDSLLAPSQYVGDPQPWLAESVEQVDPVTWDISVKDGIEWHDGEPFTAEDVAFTFEYYTDNPGFWSHHVNAGEEISVPNVESVEMAGEGVVRLNCGYPCPEMGPITLADLPVIPEHVWEDVEEPAEHTELPVGTGPYKLVSYSPERGYRFEANTDYFAGAPVIDELVMPIIADPSAAFTALRTGEIDATTHIVPPELLEELEGASDIEVAPTQGLQNVELVFNYEEQPFTSPEFRRALSLAIDREALVETVLLGVGEPGFSGYVHPEAVFSNPDVRTPFDAEEAMSILDGLGFEDEDGDGFRETPDGEPMSLLIQTDGTDPTVVRASELVVSQFAEAGVDASVETVDPGTLPDLFSSREFDMFVRPIGAHGVSDATQFAHSHTARYLGSYPEIPNPELDPLFEEWMETETLDARYEILFEMQELLAREPTSLALYYPEENWAYRPEAYDDWIGTPAFGIVHKWSLLPEESRNEAGVVALKESE